MVSSLALVYPVCGQCAFRSALYKCNTLCFLEMVLQPLKCLCLDDINHNNVVRVSMHQYHLNYYSHWGLRACCSIHICAFHDYNWDLLYTVCRTPYRHALLPWQIVLLRSVLTLFNGNISQKLYILEYMLCNFFFNKKSHYGEHVHEFLFTLFVIVVSKYMRKCLWIVGYSA